MRSLFLTILLMSGALGTVAASEVYRWVDDDGVVHYSDRPREGAERVYIREPQTIDAPARSRRSGVADDSAEAEPFSYDRLEIVSPGQEEVLWNIGGLLDVSMRLQPRLQRGHEIELYLDDQLIDLPGNSLEVTIPEVYRGVHVLRAQVKDERGQVLLESQPRTFAVRQTSIANPSNPVAPPTPTPTPGGAN